MYLREGTLIRADNSLVAIEEVTEDMRVQSFMPYDRVFYHGIVERVEKREAEEFITLAAGKRELTASKDTILPTSRGDGYLWKELGDYRPGELMLIQNLSSSVTFHEPIISIAPAGGGVGYRLFLKKYDNFVAEGFPIHTKPLPHPKNNYFDF